jgi:hypothetical protein
MEKWQMPAGWRIDTDFDLIAGQIEIVYCVQHWETWTVKLRWWHRKRVNRTGWRTLYSSPFEWKAEHWAKDTIRALQVKETK